jgi:hypothetical protein
LPVIAAIEQHEQPPGIETPHALVGVGRLVRQAEPEHVHRRADVLDLHAGALAQRGMAAIGRHHEPGADLERPVRRRRAHTDDASIRLDQVGRLRLHVQIEARVALAVRGQEIEEIPLRHQRDELAARRQVTEVHEGELLGTERAAERVRLGVRQGEEFVDQAELVHHLEGRGMDGVAAKVAQEVGVLLEHHHVHAGACEQEAEHHAGRATANDAAASGNLAQSPIIRSLAM